MAHLGSKDFENRSLHRFNQQEHLRKALYGDIEKAEGSKGGKVIGHTKSGKPIYETHNSTVHQDFSSKEHEEAVDLHEKEQGKAYDRKNFAASNFHKNQAQLHSKFSKQEKEKESKKD